MRKWIQLGVLLTATTAFSTGAVAGLIATVTDPTTNWKTVPVVSVDPAVDQQTGQEDSDIVGTLANPAFYTAFDGANLYFRVRLADMSNGGAYKGLVWVGMDVTGDGALDLFLGVNNQGSNSALGFYAPGNGANISPKTTTIAHGLSQYQISETASNYNYQRVNGTLDPAMTNSDLDGKGATDVFLSFMVPFFGAPGTASVQGALQGLENITITGDTTLSYVVATSTEANAMNQDLGGVGKNYNRESTWAQLGALSPPALSSSENASVVTPEPSAAAMLGIASALLLASLLRRRKSTK